MTTNLRLLIAILITAAAVPFIAWRDGSAQDNRPNSQPPQAHNNNKGEKFRRSRKPVREQYIVVLKSETPADEVEPLANEFLAKHGGNARHIYKHTIKGFAIQLPEAAAIALSRDPRVAYVQEDTEATIAKSETTTHWNLDRVDQRNNQRNNSYYYPNAETGAGIHAYVIDTGLRVGHRDFITNGINRASADADLVWWDNRNGDDCQGHGTSVASVLGGNTFGAAKAVRLHGVRVFDCQPSSDESTIMAGVDWVTAHHVKPAIVNMSLRIWDYSNEGNPIDEAVRASIAQGLTYVVAAGNDNTYATAMTPARIPEVITVGATTDADARWNWSNFGSAVDLFAPGVGIRTASIVDENGDGILNDATAPIDGTSFAAPLVAGVAARFLQVVPNAAPAAVQGAIISSTTRDVLTNLGDGSPNRMLFADLRHAFLGQQIKTVSESAWEVDSGVDLGPGQWLAMSGSGVIYSGQLTWFPNGPQGWTFPADSSNFPLPSAHPYSLIGQLWGGDLFYIGVSNALIQDVATPKRLLLRTNDMLPGDGAGAFTCKTELWKVLPEARADFVSQNVPNPMLPGSLQFARITMRNVGPTAWTAGQGFKLSLEGGGMTWGRNEVVLPHDVAPGTDVDFNFDFTAPLVSGTYNFQWRMLQQGVQRFGDVSTNVPIKVLSLSNDAEFVSQLVPGSMYAGESYWVSITMRNVGATIWPAGSVYRLGSQNLQDNTTWGMNRVQLFQTVSPQQQVTFTFEVNAPVTTGKKNFQWRMVKEGVEWFGATTPNVEVSVKTPPCLRC